MQYIGDILKEKGTWKEGEPLPFMHYSPMNYEQHIMCKYGVDLKGFPKPVICNPSDFSSGRQLNLLLRSLQDKTCRWEHLTDEELERRRELLYRGDVIQRKERRDKGTKRKRIENPLQSGSLNKRKRTESNKCVPRNGEEEGEVRAGNNDAQRSYCGDKENDASLA